MTLLFFFVYAGATAVLVVFVVMMLDLKAIENRVQYIVFGFWLVLVVVCAAMFLLKSFWCLKNQNAPRPSEHPPVRGGKISKRLGGIKGCKYKTSFTAFKRVPRWK